MIKCILFILLILLISPVAFSQSSIILNVVSSPVCHIADRELIAWHERITGVKDLTITLESLVNDNPEAKTNVQFFESGITKLINNTKGYKFNLEFNSEIGANLYVLSICSGTYKNRSCANYEPAQMDQLSNQPLKVVSEDKLLINMSGKSYSFFSTAFLKEGDKIILLTQRTRNTIVEKLKKIYAAKFGSAHLAEILVDKTLSRQVKLGSLPSSVVNNTLTIDIPHLNPKACR
jgi:hypothetical protein